MKMSFMVLEPKSIQVVFFVERWSFSLQDPIFWYFSEFKGLFELDLLI